MYAADLTFEATSDELHEHRTSTKLDWNRLPLYYVSYKFSVIYGLFWAGSVKCFCANRPASRGHTGAEWVQKGISPVSPGPEVYSENVFFLPNLILCVT